MLKHRADIKTLVYLSMTTFLLFYQWQYGFHIISYVFSLYLALTVAIIAHNHNHVPMWHSKTMNHITDYWITLFYGFPTFAWIPTHNRNHHKFNNREGDYTITYRVSEKNNLFTLLSYPSISSYFQQSPIIAYLKHLWAHQRTHFFYSGWSVRGFNFIGWYGVVSGLAKGTIICHYSASSCLIFSFDF
ncbi:MAG: hypothetical protein HC817_13070 [Saprospiraceae bacterium]|nr:hypothetical protein [Saprospiraceae bacterium]